MSLQQVRLRRSVIPRLPANGAVVLADNSITTAKYQNLSVTAEKLAGDIPSSKLGGDITDEGIALLTTSNVVVGAGATGVLTVGDPVYAPETLTYRPLGSGQRVAFAVSDNAMQMPADVIMVGRQNTSTVTVSIATPAVVSWVAHGLEAGDAFAFSTTGALPTGVTAGTRYYVTATGLTADTFRFSATFGGSAVNTSGTQSGVHTIKAIDLAPSMTLKIPDFDNSNSGNDHPLFAIGHSLAAKENQINSGGTTAANPLPLGIYVRDSAGADQLRLYFATGDNYALGIGTSAPSSEFQGSFLHVHNPQGTGSSLVHFTNGDTFASGTDGAIVGVMSDEALRVWHYENQPINFGVNNTQWGRLNTTGLAIGSGLAPSERLHISTSAAGAVLPRLRIDGVNSSSGKTSVITFGVQDNNAGTIRALLTVPAPLNVGNPDQGSLNLFTEDAAIPIATIDSLAANAGGRLLLFNRSSVLQTTIHSSGASTFDGGALLNRNATGGLGYGTGAGGTITQATSKATGVTLNRACGAITMNNASLAAGTIVSFVLTNSAIAATDTLILNHISGGTPGSYSLNARCAAGSATIDVRNNTAGALAEAIVIQFAVIKAVNA